MINKDISSITVIKVLVIKTDYKSYFGHNISNLVI